MLRRRDQAMMPDCTTHMAAATLGATVISKKYWAATIKITAEPKPVNGWMMPPAKAARAITTYAAIAFPPRESAHTSMGMGASFLYYFLLLPR